jgi:hypothetical protein
VYFDRHTLSLKQGQLSMYTLDGRMRFQLALQPRDEANFQQKKLREIVLARDAQNQFGLSFWFSDDAQDAEEQPADALAALPNAARIVADQLEIPEYVVVQEAA